MANLGQSFWSSLFSSSTPASTPSSSTAAAETPTSATPAPDPSQMISKYFTLGDLCVTHLPYPNIPSDPDTLANLAIMGTLLDAIQDNVGPFAIASVYRSPENQQALINGAGGAAAATMAVPKSYHSTGCAADISPTSMSTHQFAVACYNDPTVNPLLGQLCDKGDGGNETSLHISIPTDRFPTCTPMHVESNGAYVRISQDELSTWAASSTDPLNALGVDPTNDPDDQDDSSVASEGSLSGAIVGITILGALGGAYYWWFGRKKSAG
jgi:hypothetical protein